MKTVTRNILIFSIIIWTVSSSFSEPLNGTYIVGNGGNYPTLNSAIGAASSQGISGPVIFDVISGTYNVITLFIGSIPGSSPANTLTFRSQSGNAADVYITSSLRINSTNIIASHLTFQGLEFGGNNLIIKNCDFNGGGITFQHTSPQCSDFFIIENTNIGSIWCQPVVPYFNNPVNFQFIRNTINGLIEFYSCDDVTLEGNTINGVIQSTGLTLKKNKITGIIAVSGYIINNFIIGWVSADGSALVNNTIVAGNDHAIPIQGDYSSLLNNIIINPFGGTVIFSQNVSSSSDYNNLYNGGNINLIQISNNRYNSVIDFYNATGLEGHSVSIPITFTSTTDLHLSGTSIGDEQLSCLPHVNITDDIDDDPRDPNYPYKGADEADIVLPVELSSFTSLVNENNVILNWQTIREINNSGFNIERSVVTNQWINEGFVKGSGNTSSVSDYSFTDKNLSPGKYKYRLKQIDYNGNFEYFNLSSDVNIGVPDKYKLSQNYPNPFNPVTNLEFGISELGFASLKVYDVLGKEVRTLVNEIKPAGRHRVEFNGSNFASGVYFYELRSGNFVSQKRMLLLK